MLIDNMKQAMTEKVTAQKSAKAAHSKFAKARAEWWNHEQEVKEPPVPKTIAIVAMGRSIEAYLRTALMSGGRMPGIDEVWAINSAGGTISADRVFMLDSADSLMSDGSENLAAAEATLEAAKVASEPMALASAYQALDVAKAQHRPDLANYVNWLPRYKGILYSSEADPRVPSARRLPIEEIVHEFGVCYFVTTIAYALAYATYIGVERICMFGCDFAYSDTHVAETGHVNAAYWIGVARGRGVQVDICTESTLLAMNRMRPAVTHYGFDTVEAKKRGVMSPSQLQWGR